jgi:hypothetical protein
MFELTIILTSIAVLILSAYLYSVASGEPVWRLNMLAYSFWILVALSFVASIVIVLDIPFMGYQPVSSVTHFYGDVRRHLAVWGIVLWMLIGVPLGALLVNLLAGRRPLKAVMTKYRMADIQVGWGFHEKSLYQLVLFISVPLALLLLYEQSATTALTTILKTRDVYESEIVRGATRVGTGSALFDSMFNAGTLQWLSCIALAMALITGRWRWRLLFGVLFAVLIFLIVSSGVTSNVIYYLVGLGFTRSVLGRGFVKVWELVAVVGLMCLAMIIFKGAEGGILHVLWVTVCTRIFFTQLFGTYVALDYFPQHHDFIEFASTAHKVHEVLGGTTLQSYGSLLMRYYQPAGFEAGFASHLTTIFMGEAWANFGLFGIIVAPLWVGIFVQLVHRTFVSRRKSVIVIALYAYLATTFGYATDFIGFYYPVGTILFVLGVLSILVFGRVFFADGVRRLRLSAVRYGRPR